MMKAGIAWSNAARNFQSDSFNQGVTDMTKIVCISHDDPIDGSPKPDRRDDRPGIDHHPGGQTVPTPESPAGGKSIFDPHLELEMP
jgi:hypothetical protein